MPDGIRDSLTGAIVALTGDHHYIHDGKGYVLCGDTASIAAAGVEHISFTTPPVSQKVIHMRPTKFSSSGNLASITITEGAVMTGGTLAAPQNCNRLKPNDPKVTVKTGATLTTAGTGGVIYKDSVGTGSVPSRSGGAGGGSDEERVLKPDTTYSITFTNTGASTATVCSYTLFWYSE